MTVHQLMQSRWTLAGLVAALVALPNLGKGLGALSWLVNAPTIAYAAKGQADETADQFQQYLAEQRAYTQALQDYTAQMQRQLPNQVVPHGMREWEADGTCWECDLDDRQACFDEDLWRSCP